MVHVLKGSRSRVFGLKGRSPFIDRSGSPNYDTVTLQLRLSYMTVGPMLENIFSKVLMRLLSNRLDSRAPTWLEPRMVSWVAAVLVCFNWQVSFPMWG
jgi:hypothetical protein